MKRARIVILMMLISVGAGQGCASDPDRPCVISAELQRQICQAVEVVEESYKNPWRAI